MTPRQATEGIAADMVLRVVCKEDVCGVEVQEL